MLKIFFPAAMLVYYLICMQFFFECFECGFGSSCHFVLGLALCGLSPKYFVVGSLLRLDWEMVSRGPFELDSFVYLEFLYKFAS